LNYLRQILSKLWHFQMGMRIDKHYLPKWCIRVSGHQDIRLTTHYWLSLISWYPVFPISSYFVLPFAFT
jgi:hypothetical protein